MGCLLCGRKDAKEVPDDLVKPRVVCPTCGMYRITLQLQHSGLIEKQAGLKHLLSAATRQASDAGNPLTLTTENLSSLLETVPRLATPLDSLDRAMLLIGKRQRRSDEGAEIDTAIDYPLVFAHDGHEFDHLIITLAQQNLLTIPSAGNEVRLTPTGWQRVLELRRTQRDSNQAFVAMWFTEELGKAWEEGFKPALESTGFDPYRVDKDQFNEKIDDRIVAEIRRSGLLVADFTGHRQGVYFEAGFAMGLGIPVIWTCREDEIKQAHFDTRQYNHITWTGPADLRSKLALRIEATIPGRTTAPKTAEQPSG